LALVRLKHAAFSPMPQRLARNAAASERYPPSRCPRLAASARRRDPLSIDPPRLRDTSEGQTPSASSTPVSRREGEPPLHQEFEESTIASASRGVPRQEQASRRWRSSHRSGDQLSDH